jgi:hypothetical protein
MLWNFVNAVRCVLWISLTKVGYSDVQNNLTHTAGPNEWYTAKCNNQNSPKTWTVGHLPRAEGVTMKTVWVPVRLSPALCFKRLQQTSDCGIRGKRRTRRCDSRWMNTCPSRVVSRKRTGLLSDTCNFCKYYSTIHTSVGSLRLIIKQKRSEIQNYNQLSIVVSYIQPMTCMVQVTHGLLNIGKYTGSIKTFLWEGRGSEQIFCSFLPVFYYCFEYR